MIAQRLLMPDNDAMPKLQTDTVTASESADWVYCHEAFRLDGWHRLGAEGGQAARRVLNWDIPVRQPATK